MNWLYFENRMYESNFYPTFKQYCSEAKKLFKNDWNKSVKLNFSTRIQFLKTLRTKSCNSSSEMLLTDLFSRSPTTDQGIHFWILRELHQRPICLWHPWLSSTNEFSFGLQFALAMHIDFTKWSSKVLPKRWTKGLKIITSAPSRDFNFFAFGF